MRLFFNLGHTMAGFKENENASLSPIPKKTWKERNLSLSKILAFAAAMKSFVS